MPESEKNDIKGNASPEENESGEQSSYFYKIRFRQAGREYTARSTIEDLSRHETVIIKTDHGPEPALVIGRTAAADPGVERLVSFDISRRIKEDEQVRYALLPELEKEAFDVCKERIHALNLPMHLVRVERFFNGSKIIFYFTAESRVDFRELVKNLVQVFRTRVEMRQIGVRHETQMTGGIGPCGRELCCISFLDKFESVSIKMAKTQDLPLNPAKISGLCNRLLCCLTYEYDSYRSMKKGMPKLGKWVEHEGKEYRVVRLMPLQGNVLVVSRDGDELTLIEEQWRAAKPVHKGQHKGQQKTQTKKK